MGKATSSQSEHGTEEHWCIHPLLSLQSLLCDTGWLHQGSPFTSLDIRGPSPSGFPWTADWGRIGRKSGEPAYPKKPPGNSFPSLCSCYKSLAHGPSLPRFGSSSPTN